MRHRKALLHAPGDQTLRRIPKFLTFQREDIIVDEMNFFAVSDSLHDPLPQRIEQMRKRLLIGGLEVDTEEHEEKTGYAGRRLYLKNGRRHAGNDVLRKKMTPAGIEPTSKV